MTDEVSKEPQAAPMWRASQITELFGLNDRTMGSLLVAAVARLGGWDQTGTPLGAFDAELNADGAAAVFQLAYDTAVNDDALPAAFVKRGVTRDRILSDWRVYLTCGSAAGEYDGSSVAAAIDAANEMEDPGTCTHEVTHLGTCVAYGAGDDSAEPDDATSWSGLTGNEMAQEYAADDAQTRRELAAGDDSAIRDDSWEEEVAVNAVDAGLTPADDDTPTFREDRVADGSRRKLSATAQEIDRLFAETKRAAGYPERVDGMELGHRLFDYRADSWTGKQMGDAPTVADLRRGEIVRLPGRNADHVVLRTYPSTQRGRVHLNVARLGGFSVHMGTYDATEKDFQLRLDLLYLEPKPLPTDEPDTSDPMRWETPWSGPVHTMAETGLPERIHDLELRLNPWAAFGQAIRATVLDVCRGDVIRGDRNSVDRIVLTALHGGEDGSSLTLTGPGSTELPVWHNPATPVWIRRDVAYVPSVEPEEETAWDLDRYPDAVGRPVERLSLAPAYRGVPVPEALWPNLDQPEFAWWCRGVRSVLRLDASSDTTERDDGR